MEPLVEAYNIIQVPSDSNHTIRSSNMAITNQLSFHSFQLEIHDYMVSFQTPLTLSFQSLHGRISSYNLNKRAYWGGWKFGGHFLDVKPPFFIKNYFGLVEVSIWGDLLHYLFKEFALTNGNAQNSD